MKKLGGGYEGRKSIFDSIDTDDLILAFFPCTRFEAKVPLWFRGESFSQRNWTLQQKLKTSISMQKELSELYCLLCMMVSIVDKKGLKMVIENPYTQPHYLTTYWCIKPTLIDKDRTENGDYYKKPTQYWFINMKPLYNFIFEPIDYVPQKVIARTKASENTSIKTERSMIHPQYANRFIRQYLINENEKGET